MRAGSPEAPAASHGTAVIVGETGVLIRGEPGSGKSSLALALLDGRPVGSARLVGDDRVLLSVAHGRLLARAHPQIAGLIEERGAGLLHVEFEPAAIIRCVVDLIPQDPGCDIPPRLPEILTVKIRGVELPRLSIPRSLPAQEAAARVRRFVHRQST